MEDISKALRLLNLPDEFASFDGQIIRKITYVPVEVKFIDFSERVNGAPKTTSALEFRPVLSNFGSYSLNMLNMYLHSFGFTYLGDGVLNKEKQFKTIDVGPFAGYTYWYPWQELKASPNELTLISCPFKNTDKSGYPEPTGGVNPKITLLRETYFKTATFTSSKPSKSYPSYTKEDILNKFGFSEYDFAASAKTSFLIANKDTNTFVTSTATDVIVNGDVYEGKVFINGVEYTQPINLLTSYGIQYPGFVVRWRLYNSLDTTDVYGANVTVEFSSTEDNKIKLVAGNEASWNEEARELTYDASKPAQLWFTFEEYPATGKNYGGETILYL